MALLLRGRWEYSWQTSYFSPVSFQAHQQVDRKICDHKRFHAHAHIHRHLQYVCMRMHRDILHLQGRHLNVGSQVGFVMFLKSFSWNRLNGGFCQWEVRHTSWILCVLGLWVNSLCIVEVNIRTLSMGCNKSTNLNQSIQIQFYSVNVRQRAAQWLLQRHGGELETLNGP